MMITLEYETIQHIGMMCSHLMYVYGECGDFYTAAECQKIQDYVDDALTKDLSIDSSLIDLYYSLIGQ